MKRIIFFLLVLISTVCAAQNKIDALEFQGKVTTLIRDTYVVPTGGAMFIWNLDSQQFEYADDSQTWLPLTGLSAADQGKLDNIIITQSVDLDALEASVATLGAPDWSAILNKPANLDLDSTNDAELDGTNVFTSPNSFTATAPVTMNGPNALTILGQLHFNNFLFSMNGTEMVIYEKTLGGQSGTGFYSLNPTGIPTDPNDFAKVFTITDAIAIANADLAPTELRLPVRTADPASTVSGKVYYDSNTESVKVSNGTTYNEIGGGDFTKVGTTVANQVMVAAGDGIIGSAAGFTWNETAYEMGIETMNTVNLNPSILGFVNMNSGTEGGRFQFGDEFNTIENQFSQGMNLRSYHTLVLTGGSEDSASELDFTNAMYATDATEALRINMLHDNQFTIRQSTGTARTSPFLEIQNNVGSVLAGVNASGQFTGDGSQLDNIVASVGSGRTNPILVTDIYGQTEADYATDGASPADELVIIIDKKRVGKFIIPLGSVGADIVAGTDITFVPVDEAITITSVSANVKTAGTTSTITIDINLGATTIMATNKIEIEATESWSSTATTQPVVTQTTIPANSFLNIDIDAVDSGNTALDGTVIINYTYDN